MSLEELENEIAKLPLSERAALAKWIVQSLDDLSTAEVDTLWTEEAERRLDELEQDAKAEIPAVEALRQARSSLS